jgi:glycosyltransferase involved in cell wall biosynthesis
MTASADPRSPRDQARTPFGASWRAERERIQEAALPRGRVVVSCSAPFGHGGLGRHATELADTLDRAGQQGLCICGRGGETAAGASPRRELSPRGLGATLAPVVSRFPEWRAWSASVAFDAQAARELSAIGEPSAVGERPAVGEPRAIDHLIAFNGQALAQFEAARELRCESISLVAANSHLRRVVRQHELALRRYPIERSWPRHLLKRNLREYTQADRIYVASEYIWESFIEEGIAAERLSRFPLTPDPRYRPDDARERCDDASVRAHEARGRSDAFDIVYVGSLTVAKGVALLVDAFSRLAHTDMRLVLVGGWGTRGMRRFLLQACARDPRISISPGDPLAHLRRARLCVHAAYEDGFAYAPAEALACGVPVIVSADTGMKELIDAERNGVIVATGELPALSEAIDAAYAGEILGG